MDGVFYCPEESRLYAGCLKTLIFAREDAPRTMVEFGSGDGGPVIESLRGSEFTGSIRGYELNPTACVLADHGIKLNNLQDHYTIYNESFFARPEVKAECLIANPPYLPAPDSNIRLPLLYGGDDGSMLTNILLSMGYQDVMLMISSYSNPLGTIHHALAQGYAVSDFVVAPLTFGAYSCESKVKRRIEALRTMERAFYDGDTYLLAGVLFEKARGEKTDLSYGLIKLMTAL